MKIPPGLNEELVLEAIERAVRILAPVFVFGYHDLDDMKQEGRIFGLQCLEKYDSSRPFPNFVYVHIRNRLSNFKRKHFRRTDPPCPQCHEGNFCSGERLCKKYANWLTLNNSKASIMRPKDIDAVYNHVEDAADAEADAEWEETSQRIDERLPIELRTYYLQMLDGVFVPKAKKQLVLDELRRILGVDHE